MPANGVMSEKKKALLAYKEHILQELKYFDSRIEDVRNEGKKHSFCDIDSSDTEDELIPNIDVAPSVPELKHEQAMLRTCLQATQELTSLQVLQSEVNVLVDDPEIVGEPPVTEPGVWREVTAECRVDLVPFSITFFMHQPERHFGSPSYRGLRVSPVKAAHEGELGRSVLSSVTRPSDAVEILKSFARAQRSRRSTLARLADKFANTLYMEPMPDGGYILKCANLLEVSWTLQNKWSPIAPFHHRMKFDLEYMDESYIKTITQAHRQLSDPTIETAERTMLLARIISVCLEAQGPTQELYESMSSDPGAAQSLKERRTTLDQEPDAPAGGQRAHGGQRAQGGQRDEGGRGDSDREVMAPPKTVPKRAKAKGKENIAVNRKEKLKRGNSNEDMNKNKKLKVVSDTNRNSQENDAIDNEDEEVIIDTRQSNVYKEKNVINREENNVASKNNNEVKKSINDKTESSSKNIATAKNTENLEKVKTVKSKSDLVSAKDNAKALDSNRNDNKAKIVREKSDLNKNNAAKSKNTVVSDNNANTAKVVKEKSSEKLKINAKSLKDAKIVENATKTVKEKGNPEKEQTKATEEVIKKGGKEKVGVRKGQEKNNEIVKQKIVEKVQKPKKNPKESNIGEEAESVSKFNKKIEDKTKKVNSKININGMVREKTVIKNVSDKEKGDAITNAKDIARSKEISAKATNVKTNSGNDGKTKVITKTKQVSQDTKSTTKVIGNVKAKISTKNNEISNKEKDNVANTKTKTAEETKTTNNKVAAKNVTNVKNKNLPTKDDKIKKSTNKTDQNKESTIEKAVERRSIVKRKSNLANIDNNGASKKTTNKPKIDNIATGNTKNVALKRKSNFAEDTNSVASAKKRVLTTENVAKKVNSDSKNKPENKFQKAMTKFESKFKTKLMTGAIKTHSAGNTKVFVAGNIDKGSKIPQKKLSSASEATMRKNPLRISPRKFPSKFKSPSDGPKSIQKTTSIPRLLKKPMAKT